MTKLQKNKDLITQITKKNKLLKDSCEFILNKYKDPSLMIPKDYIYFVFCSNLRFKIRDILILNKKLILEKNVFDSSLYILNRSVLEDFFYLSYLLSDPTKTDFKLKALTCHNNQSNLSLFESFKRLSIKNKFIFNVNLDSVLSEHMMEIKTKEWSQYINDQKEKQEDLDAFNKEIEQFKFVEQICQKYDKENNINKVEDGTETESLEWMYNYLYRFQSMSVHQNLNDKEKIFNLYLNKTNDPNNDQILSLLLHIIEKTLIMV